MHKDISFSTKSHNISIAQQTKHEYLTIIASLSPADRDKHGQDAEEMKDNHGDVSEPEETDIPSLSTT